MSDQPDSTPTHQPGAISRVPGNRTPRRVQWASAVDKDDVLGRKHGDGLESDAGSTHELDEAALDVRATSIHIIPCFPPIFFPTASCVPNAHPRS